MKIFTIEPVNVHEDPLGDVLGAIDVTYEHKSGFMWRKKETVTRRAFSNDGVWRWLDKRDEWLLDVGDIIEAHSSSILNGKPVVISHPLDNV